MRSATSDTELGGRKIAKGDWLMLCYASGNRDEEVFDEPFKFRCDRKPNKHVSFGYLFSPFRLDGGAPPSRRAPSCPPARRRPP